MAGGKLRGRAVGPVLDDELTRDVQLPAEPQDFLGIFTIAATILENIRLRHHVVKLLSRGQCKGRDQSPVRTDKTLQGARRWRTDQWLPVLRERVIHRLRQWRTYDDQRCAKAHGRIAWRVTR